jgi:hypothetical protein
MSTVEQPTMELRRHEPEHWAGFVDLAEGAVDQNGTPNLMGRFALYRALSREDLYTIDESRYYAIGKVLCSFGRLLNEVVETTEGHEYITSEFAKFFVEDDPNPNLSRLNISEASRVFDSIWEEVIDGTDPVERTLINALEATCDYRVVHEHSARFIGKLKGNISLARSDENDIFFTNLRLGTANGFAGMLNLIGIAAVWSGEEPLENKDPNIRAELFKELRSAEVLKLLRGLCTIPLEIFNISIDRLLDQHVGKELGSIKQIDWAEQRSYERQFAGLRGKVERADPYFYRYDRLVCPAANVSDFLAMMQNLLVDILEKLCEDLDAVEPTTIEQGESVLRDIDHN